MLIAISGTPGTGKTAVSRILAKELRAKLLTTGFLAGKYGIKTLYDRRRKSKIIDQKKLAAAAVKEAKKHEMSIFDSHLAHFARADVTIILRTEPAELAKRLEKRGWSREKVRENVEAEAIGVITAECRHAIEIDTTGKTPEKTARLIKKLLNNHSLQKRYLPGRIDWSEKYGKYLKG